MMTLGYLTFETSCSKTFEIIFVFTLMSNVTKDCNGFKKWLQKFQQIWEVFLKFEKQSSRRSMSRETLVFLSRDWKFWSELFMRLQWSVTGDTVGDPLNGLILSLLCTVWSHCDPQIVWTSPVVHQIWMRLTGASSVLQYWSSRFDLVSSRLWPSFLMSCESVVSWCGYVSCTSVRLCRVQNDDARIPYFLNSLNFWNHFRFCDDFKCKTWLRQF